jgi:DNA-binding transcriptional LysR family regulator
VAQSALSHQVRRLESELGTELFERTSRRVSPTEAGEAVAARARRVLAEVDGVREEIDELRGVRRGRIAIGALLPGGEIDVPGLLARFSAAHPGIEVGLREGTAGDMFRYLEEDTIDAAFCLLYGDLPEGLVSEVLSEDEVVAVFAPGDAPDKELIGVADLEARSIVAPRPGSTIKAAVENLFARSGKQLRVSLESADPFLLRCLVAGGFGTGILPLSLTRREGPEIEMRSLGPSLRLPVALVWRERRHVSPAASAFIEFVRDEVSSPR